MKLRDLKKILLDLGYTEIRRGNHILFKDSLGNYVNVPVHQGDEYQKKGWVRKLLKKHGYNSQE